MVGKVKKILLRFFGHCLLLHVVNMIISKLYFSNFSWTQLFYLQMDFSWVLAAVSLLITLIVNKLELL